MSLLLLGVHTGHTTRQNGVDVYVNASFDPKPPWCGVVWGGVGIGVAVGIPVGIGVRVNAMARVRVRAGE